MTPETTQNPWGSSSGAPPAAPPVPAPQIADRTYRHYDGPLRTHAARWWVVALATIRANLRKPTFWIPAGLVFLSYIVHALLLYFLRDQIEQMGADPSILPTPTT